MQKLILGLGLSLVLCGSARGGGINYVTPSGGGGSGVSLSDNNTWTGLNTFTQGVTGTSATLSSDLMVHSVSATYVFGNGAGLTALGTTSYAVFGLVISTFGTDTNTLQSTFSYISVMGDAYVNVSTMVSMALSPCAGGRDGTPETASRWYKIFAISKGNGGGFALILTDAGNIQPVLPAGYTKWMLVGYVFNNASSNILAFHKEGDMVTFWNLNIAINVGASPATSWTQVDLTSVISTAAVSVQMEYHINPQATGFVSMWVKSPDDLNSGGSFPMVGTNGTASSFSSGDFEVPFFNNRQTVFYKSGGVGTGEFYVYAERYKEVLR